MRRRRTATAVSVVSVLKESAVAKSILFDVDPECFFCVSMWEYTLREQRCNVDACLAEKKSVLKKKEMLLVNKDLELCSRFSTLFNTVACHCGLLVHVFQCYLYELCHEFIKISRKIDYSDFDAVCLADLVIIFFEIEQDYLVVDMCLTLQELVYYIAGWLLCASLKVSRRRNKKFAENIRFLVNVCKYETDCEAIDCGLPAGKVQRVEAFDGLLYCTAKFFAFVVCIDRIFTKALSKEYVMVYGSLVVNKIKDALFNDKIVRLTFCSFLPSSCEEETYEKILNYFLNIYS